MLLIGKVDNTLSHKLIEIHKHQTKKLTENTDKTVAG
jgi:hypothetical protein